MLNEFSRRLMDMIQFNSWIASFADPSRQILAIENYAYCIDALAVDIEDGSPADFPLIMDSDSEFIATYISGAARIDDGPTVSNGTRCTEFSPSILIQITDQSSGNTWFNAPTPLPLIAGAGGFPFLMASPRVIRPRSTLSVHAEIADNGGATPVLFSDFFFAIHGAKIYYAGPTQ